ncbi:MAG: signal recognition particle-docking protein FtsY [Christensenellaceae bacterium]|jgi:fused signal recognition particle receptor|nr:signal recognition particle-docking protein FtsY [Christensenellaceae bacterium]
MGFFKRLLGGLKKTKDNLAAKWTALFKGEINDEFYEELELVLISSDVGTAAAEEILNNLKTEVKKGKIKKAEDAKEALRKVLTNILEKPQKLDLSYPCVLMIVGVNGVGKTTTIGKLARYFSDKKKSVTLVAGDTFRAAASEQLNEWANRSNVKIIKHAEGADAAAVVFDGIASAKAKNTDVLIIDTAGRLHTKVNLMEELKKIGRVTKRESPDANIKNLIVLDATIGQNSIAQVNAFKDAIGIDGIILTKLDGTSKGGVVFSIIKELDVPVSFIGVGEKIDDLDEFSAEDFVNAIL